MLFMRFPAARTCRCKMKMKSSQQRKSVKCLWPHRVENRGLCGGKFWGGDLGLTAAVL